MKKQPIAAIIRRIAAVASLCVAQALVLWPAVARAQQSGDNSVGANRPLRRASVQSKTENDLRRITFRTEQGQLALLLPAQVAPGDTVSGTITLTPSGRSAEERSRNEEALRAYKLELAFLPPTRVDSDQNRAVWTVPPAPSEDNHSQGFAVVLRDGSGQEIGRTTLPAASGGNVTSATTQENAFVLPPRGKAGAMLSIRGRFDGDAVTTNVRIGGDQASTEATELTVVAESPRLCVVQTPREARGKTQVTLREGSAAESVRGSFDHQKAPRRNAAGTVLGVVLVVGIVAAIAIAESFKGGFGGWGGS